MLDLHALAIGELPSALADLHRSAAVGARRQVRLPPVDETMRRDLTHGAGFSIARGARAPVTTLERQWTLPDTLAADVRLVVCGLNPSPAAADAGVAFHRPGNRFWPAALAAGLVTIDRDPIHALDVHGIGMTDIVKRTTRRAAELGADEYRAGVERLRRLTAWARPGALCFVGLAGWRTAVDPAATPGWQPGHLGDIPVYVMPSTSGLNAHSSLDDLTAHLRHAAERTT